MSNEHSGCADYEKAANLSRRRFLQGVAATGAGAVATTMFGDALRQTAFGATGGGNVLVVISLRGGVDGLGMVVPHGDPGYYAARPRIGVSRASLVAQDSFFGLHPSMRPLAWLYDSGELAAVHAVGMERPNRSHFLAMEEIEDADPGSSTRRGWVNRMIALDKVTSPTEAVHVNGTVVPTMLTGPAPTLAATKLDGLALAGAVNGWEARRRAQLSTVWGKAPGPLGVAGRAALTVSRRLAPVVSQTYNPHNGVVYPASWPAAPLAAALKDTAQLIRADVGAEIISVDHGSWDMHSEYGGESSGQMQAMVTAFAQSVDAFMRDLGPSLRARVTLVTISEFGRRVAENGNRGLDHGWGNMMLLIGGGVRGGAYYGRWPWLRAATMEDGDLAVTTDYRNVLGEVITRRFPDRSIGKVFPGLSYAPLGVMT
ncbi:MAG TPA: DUF1501 domain-containing protein [Nocardioidaceae bacterium]|nr:DUF1501 domain-containing protein [Nocardioidaceae bacterium]